MLVPTPVVPTPVLTAELRTLDMKAEGLIAVYRLPLQRNVLILTYRYQNYTNLDTMQFLIMIEEGMSKLYFGKYTYMYEHKKNMFCEGSI